MAPYQKKASETVEFLTNLYGTTQGNGRIELRAKSADGPVVAREFCSTYDKVQRFADKYGKKDDKLAVYYGVGKRAADAKDGRKESVLELPALWSDIDVGKHGWDYATIVKAIHDLPGSLQPSALVHSGGGLHAYWLLTEPVTLADESTWHDDVRAFETVNKSFGQFTAGDNVFDVSRVLRLPGTFNCRRNKACHVIWFYRWHKHTLLQLEQAREDFGLFLGPTGFVKKEDLPIMAHGTDAVKAFHYATDPGRRDWQSKHAAIWSTTRMGGGFPYYGLDEAQLLATAYLWAFEETPLGSGAEEAKKRRIVSRVLEETKAVKSNDMTGARSENWDWDGEEMKIRYKLDRWVTKWAYLQEVKAQEKRQAAKTRAADKKAANGKED
jgi:hypothetical protein